MHHICNDVSRLFLMQLSARTCYSSCISQKRVAILLTPSYVESLRVTHSTYTHTTDHTNVQRDICWRNFPDGSGAKTDHAGNFITYAAYNEKRLRHGLEEKWQRVIKWSGGDSFFTQTERCNCANNYLHGLTISYELNEIHVWFHGARKAKFDPAVSLALPEGQVHLKHALDYFNILSAINCE